MVTTFLLDDEFREVEEVSRFYPDPFEVCLFSIRYLRENGPEEILDLIRDKPELILICIRHQGEGTIREVRHLVGRISSVHTIGTRFSPKFRLYGLDENDIMQGSLAIFSFEDVGPTVIHNDEDIDLQQVAIQTSMQTYGSFSRGVEVVSYKKKLIVVFSLLFEDVDAKDKRLVKNSRLQLCFMTKSLPSNKYLNNVLRLLEYEFEGRVIEIKRLNIVDEVREKIKQFLALQLRLQNYLQ